jgi:hypothetical protein
MTSPSGFSGNIVGKFSAERKKPQPALLPAQFVANLGRLRRPARRKRFVEAAPVDDGGAEESICDWPCGREHNWRPAGRASPPRRSKRLT